MASLRKRGKTWFYIYTDADGVRHERKGCSDRRVTEELAQQAESEAARVKAGLFDPKELAYRDHEARSLKEHVDAWRANLVADGSTSKHAELAPNRVRRLVAVMLGSDFALKGDRVLKPKDRPGFVGRIIDIIAPARLSDLTTEGVQGAIGKLKDKGLSLQSCNHYRAAIRTFSKWCHDTHRTREHLLRGVKGFNAKEDRRHDRRTVSLDELQRLIAVAEQGPVVLGVAGPIRALCYRLAIATGLRYSEIASIRPNSFDWKAPSVVVTPSYTKNGQNAVMPIPDDLASDLSPYVATLAPGDPVFPLPKGKGAELLQADLAVAGIAYQDVSGLFFDFHSLRCELATRADAAGVSPRVVQRLMRHSSLELTGRYTRPRAVDIENAASMLPSLKPSGDRPDSLAATGTDGRFATLQSSDQTGAAALDAENSSPEGHRISEAFATHLPRAGDGSSRDPSGSDAISRSDARKPMERKPLETRGMTVTVVSGRDLSREAPVGVEPTYNGFADRRLTTWLRRRENNRIGVSAVTARPFSRVPRLLCLIWSGENRMLANWDAPTPARIVRRQSSSVYGTIYGAPSWERRDGAAR
jgi:integrase